MPRARKGKEQPSPCACRSIPSQAPPPKDEQEFLQKVLLSETLWEKLISSE